MTRKKIYINRIATVFLFFYSFFLIFASFHTHKINLQNGNSYHLEESKSSNKQTDPFLDGKAKCLLVQFSKTQFFNPFIIDRLFETPDSEKLNLSAEQNFNLSRTHHSITLRAPPTIS